MVIVERKYRKEWRSFKVYTEDEAVDERIAFKRWDLCQVGEWGLTTDGYVMECLRRVTLKNADLVEFSGGRAMTGTPKFEFWPRFKLRDWWGLKPGSWAEKEAQKTRAKNVVKLYVQQVLAGKVDYGVLGKAYRPDQKIPEATVRRLFKKEEIKRMIHKEMEEALRNLGIDRQFVLDKILVAMNIAEKKGDSGNMLRGAENLSDMLEMKPQKGHGNALLPPEAPMGELPSFDAILTDMELPAVKGDDDQ